MSARTTPPFRADHVGSLLRPKELLDARAAAEGDVHRTLKGSMRLPQLKALEDRCIRDAVALQESVGLKSITDGEFRRRSWWADFFLELANCEVHYGESDIYFRDAKGHKLPGPTTHFTGRISRPTPINVDNFKFLQSATRATPKVSMPAPGMAHLFGGRKFIDRKTYPDLDEFWRDLTDAYRREIADLGAAGCRYVQIDDVVFPLLCDPNIRSQVTARGDDPDRLVHVYADAINRAIETAPKGMTIAMHQCRGNNQGHWMAEGGYDWVADTLFNRINIGAYFLEYDSPRAGTFSPLRLVPKGKIVVLGLVCSKTPKLEDADELKRRIDAAAKYVPLENLCISPQCGFASLFLGNAVTVDDEKRKLELIVRVAQDVWGSA
ncbi:MAG: 5-methyltetrahydropteroyltriglutamate--homocysteine S-methyltransferase [Alphaproteobacteria bacterium]